MNRLEVAQSLLSLGDQSHTVEPTRTREKENQEVDDGTATQTDLTISLIQKMQEELAGCYKIIGDLNSQISQHKTFSEAYLINDDVVKFYSGLPNLTTLKAVYDLVSKSMSSQEGTKLTDFQEFMATMAKLRLNCPLQDLATRINVSCATVSRI